MEPQKIIDIFKKITGGTLIEIAIVVIGALALVWLLEKISAWLAKRLHSRIRLLVLAPIPIARVIVFVVAFVWIFQLLIEITLQNMIVILGAVGIAVGFALKDYISSLIAGVVVAYEMPYQPGDWIEINGTYGEVKHIGSRVVTIVTPDDTLVFIPHQKIWTESVYNAINHDADLMCITNFYLDPDHNPEQVCRVLEDVALSSPYINLKNSLQVLLDEKPWGTHYRIKAYPMDPRQQFQFNSDLTARGKQYLRELQIKFARVLSDYTVNQNK